MILSPQEYTTLSKAHRAELQRLVKDKKTDVLSIYLNQAEDLLRYISSLTPGQLTDPDLLIERLARFDIELDGFNATIFPEVQNAQQALISLGYDHTSDYIVAGFSALEIPASFRRIVYQDILDELVRPIPDSPFNLSSAIWGKDKRESLYKFIHLSAKTRRSPSEIVSMLEKYLTGSEQSGQLYKAVRVVDSEFQRAYSAGSIRSTREYNDQNDEKLLYKRATSPAHRITDICDELEGVYDAESKVPGVPSHALCICLISRIFASDYSGKIKSFGNLNEFISEKFNQRTHLS